jgi:hypothetical protein
LINIRASGGKLKIAISIKTRRFYCSSPGLFNRKPKPFRTTSPTSPLLPIIFQGHVEQSYNSRTVIPLFLLKETEAFVPHDQEARTLIKEASLAL